MDPLAWGAVTESAESAVRFCRLLLFPCSMSSPPAAAVSSNGLPNEEQGSGDGSSSSSSSGSSSSSSGSHRRREKKERKRKDEKRKRKREKADKEKKRSRKEKKEKKKNKEKKAHVKRSIITGKRIQRKEGSVADQAGAACSLSLSLEPGA